MTVSCRELREQEAEREREGEGEEESEISCSVLILFFLLGDDGRLFLKDGLIKILFLFPFYYFLFFADVIRLFIVLLHRRIIPQKASSRDTRRETRIESFHP